MTVWLVACFGGQSSVDSLLSRGWVDKLTSVFSWFSEPFREAQPEEQAPANPTEGEEKKVGT